jgi:hypothetical protein
MSRLTEVGAARLPNSDGDLLIVLNEPDGDTGLGRDPLA